MELSRNRLTLLLNRLYDRGEERFTVEHPSTEIGPLVSVKLTGYNDARVTFDTRRDGYITAREEIRRSYPETVYKDLPDADQYVKTFVASGLIDIENFDEVQAFVEQHGDPDLMAGHPPVVAGFDTNLMSWRIDQILGLRDPDAGVGYVNGLVVATGVRDELDWDYKCDETAVFEAAFGEAYAEYWNQPLGDARIGRLGLLTYRTIRDIQQAHELSSDIGDEAIVEAYDEYDNTHRAQVIVFSNDRTFIERARAHTVLGQHIAFPRDVPRTASASWRDLEHLLYRLAVVFGVVEVPTTTLFGVWRGKTQSDWQSQRVKLECRSSTLRPLLERDIAMVDTFDDLI